MPSSTIILNIKGRKRHHHRLRLQAASGRPKLSVPGRPLLQRTFSVSFALEAPTSPYRRKRNGRSHRGAGAANLQCGNVLLFAHLPPRLYVGGSSMARELALPLPPGRFQCKSIRVVSPANTFSYAKFRFGFHMSDRDQHPPFSPPLEQNRSADSAQNYT